MPDNEHYALPTSKTSFHTSPSVNPHRSSGDLRCPWRTPSGSPNRPPQTGSDPPTGTLSEAQGVLAVQIQDRILGASMNGPLIGSIHATATVTARRSPQTKQTEGRGPDLVKTDAGAIPKSNPSPDAANVVCNGRGFSTSIDQNICLFESLTHSSPVWSILTP